MEKQEKFMEITMNKNKETEIEIGQKAIKVIKVLKVVKVVEAVEILEID